MLKLGVGERVITPPLGTPIEGNIRKDNLANGKYDDLYIKAMVFQEGKSTVALVVLDVCLLPKSVVMEFRKQIQTATGIPGKNIMIAATHTHSGPVTQPLFAYKIIGNAHPHNIIPVLAQKTVEAVQEALLSLQKVNMLVGVGQNHECVFNRRLKLRNGKVKMMWEVHPSDPQVMGPAGPVDPEVGVLSFRNKNGETVAVLINYASHTAILAGLNNYLSSDFAGYMRDKVKQFLGNKAMVVFTNGAEGNMVPIPELHPNRTIQDVKKVGENLAGTVIQILQSNLQPMPALPLKIKNTTITVSFRKISSKEYASARNLLKHYDGHDLSLADGIPDEVYADGMVTLYKRIQKEKHYSTELQAMVLGDTVLMNSPGELFVEFGLEIKWKSPFTHTFIIGLANDYMGYIPTPQAFREGGYEPHTMNNSSMLDIDTGDLLVKKTLKLLHSLNN